VYKIDARRGLVYVKGAVPGRAGRVVRIQFQLVIIGMESKVMKKMKNY
jgi:ribosomal protein L3